MKAVVLGATGLVGGSLVRQLAEAEHITQVVALCRRPIAVHGEKVQYKVVDFDHLESELRGMQADLLFSCLGTTKKIAGSIEAQRIVDVHYQLEVFQTLVRQGLKHYLLVSSSGAHERSSNAYLKMKGELEREVKIIFEDSKMNTLHILQPSLLKGPRKEFRLGESIGTRISPLLTCLPFFKKYRPIHVDEVAEKMVLLSREGLGVNKTHTLDEVFPTLRSD